MVRPMRGEKPLRSANLKIRFLWVPPMLWISFLVFEQLSYGLWVHEYESVFYFKEKSLKCFIKMVKWSGDFLLFLFPFWVSVAKVVEHLNSLWMLNKGLYRLRNKDLMHLIWTVQLSKTKGNVTKLVNVGLGRRECLEFRKFWNLRTILEVQKSIINVLFLFVALTSW